MTGTRRKTPATPTRAPRRTTAGRRTRAAVAMVAPTPGSRTTGTEDPAKGGTPDAAGTPGTAVRATREGANPSPTRCPAAGSDSSRFHRQPMRKRKTTASRMARRSTRGRPVLFGGSCSARIGSIFSHIPSGTRQIVGSGFVSAVVVVVPSLMRASTSSNSADDARGRGFRANYSSTQGPSFLRSRPLATVQFSSNLDAVGEFGSTHDQQSACARRAKGEGRV